GLVMRPLFAAARKANKRVVYAEGEEERVLRAAQVAVDEGLARPILIGRPSVVEMRIRRAGLRLVAGGVFELVDPENCRRVRVAGAALHKVRARDGVPPAVAKAALRRSHTITGAMLVRRGDADAMVCGLVGRFDAHLENIASILGLAPGARQFAAMNAIVLDKHTLFVADTFVNDDPDAQQLADIARMAAVEVSRFGLPPKVAFLSHSNFGSSQRPSARKMREARDLFRATCPGIEADGELHGDAALNESLRGEFLQDSTLTGSANILICPNLDAANILFNVLKTTGGQGVHVGPMLLGAAAPVHILTPSATVRRIVNMTALASADDRAFPPVR